MMEVTSLTRNETRKPLGRRRASGKYKRQTVLFVTQQNRTFTSESSALACTRSWWKIILRCLLSLGRLCDELGYADPWQPRTVPMEPTEKILECCIERTSYTCVTVTKPSTTPSLGAMAISSERTSVKENTVPARASLGRNDTIQHRFSLKKKRSTSVEADAVRRSSCHSEMDSVARKKRANASKTTTDYKMFTHFPKDPSCGDNCRMTKTTRA